MTVVTGVAAVGDREATVTAGGWSYGIEGGVQFWIDSHSGVHEGGWPSCLKLGEGPKVTIGAVPASLPGGSDVGRRAQARQVGLVIRVADHELRASSQTAPLSQRLVPDRMP